MVSMFHVSEPPIYFMTIGERLLDEYGWLQKEVSRKGAKAQRSYRSSTSPLTIRVMPFVISSSLKLINSPNRLSAR